MQAYNTTILLMDDTDELRMMLNVFILLNMKHAQQEKQCFEGEAGYVCGARGLNSYIIIAFAWCRHTLDELSKQVHVHSWSDSIFFFILGLIYNPACVLCK